MWRIKGVQNAVFPEKCAKRRALVRPIEVKQDYILLVALRVK